MMRTYNLSFLLVSSLLVTGPTGAEEPSPAEASPAQACYQNALARVESWAAEGHGEEELARRVALALESCAGPETESAMAMMWGAAQMDARLAALRVRQEDMLPRDYVALVRDRSRKARAAENDAESAQAWAESDKDGDLVADSRDDCPDTPALRLTDEVGCEVDFPAPREGEDDPAPSALVLALLDKMGLMHVEACDGAPAPAIPSPIQIGYSPDLLYIKVAVAEVRNQPAGCPVFYEIRSRHAGMRDGGQNQPFGVVVAEHYPVRYTRMMFRASEDTDPAPTTAVFAIGPGTPISEGRVLFKEGWAVFGHTDFETRAVNGNGQASGWSSRAVSEPRMFQ